jgi:hypothetical protein
LDNPLVFDTGLDEDIREATEAMGMGVNDPAAAIKLYLARTNEAVCISSTKYIYINKDMGWVLMNSVAAAKKICVALDLYAPVNFLQATMPIVASLQHWNPSVVVMPLTVSQGNIRCSFKIVKGADEKMKAIEFTPVVPINTRSDSSKRAIRCTAK